MRLNTATIHSNGGHKGQMKLEKGVLYAPSLQQTGNLRPKTELITQITPFLSKSQFAYLYAKYEKLHKDEI